MLQKYFETLSLANEAHLPAGSPGGTGGQFAPKHGELGTSSKAYLKQTSTPAFKEWFGDSKVVDDNGDPLVVYHGTTENWRDSQDIFDTSRGELGIHFGTKEIASKFFAEKYTQNWEYNKNQPGRIFPVFLSIQHPLVMRDPGSWSYERVLEALVENGSMTQTKAEQLRKTIKGAWSEYWDAPKKNPFPINEHVKKWLKDAGYDGIKYLNRREGDLPSDVLLGDTKNWSDEKFLENAPKATISWIALEPEQIKSAIGNKGTYSRKEKSIAAAFDPAQPRDSDGKWTDKYETGATYEANRRQEGKSFGLVGDLEKKFTYDGINYDSANGIGGGAGRTVNNRYEGFVTFMTPQQFLDLNPERVITQNIPEITEAIKKGTPISPPTIHAEYDDTGKFNSWRVVGHEGRGRVTAIIAARPDVKKVPVFVTGRRENGGELRGGTHADDPRQITKEMLFRPFFSDMRRKADSIVFWPKQVIMNRNEYENGEMKTSLQLALAPLFLASVGDTAHPGFPAGAPGGVGGQFMPKHGATGTVAPPEKPTSIEWAKNVAPQDFIDARNKSKKSAFLSHVEAADLKDHKLILSKDGTVGAAVSPSGDIQNVFNNGGPKGAATEVMLEAIHAGGKTLDCYRGFLPGYYSTFGFTETGHMKFNREYAPSDWDYDKYGTPDVVFMALTNYKGDTVARATNKQWQDTRYQPSPTGTDYSGEQWDKAKSDSLTAANATAIGKSAGTKSNGTGNKFSGGRVSSDSGRGVVLNKRQKNFYHAIAQSGNAADIIKSLYDKNDPVDQLSTFSGNADANMHDVIALRMKFKQDAQEHLKRKGISGTVKMYRGGDPFLTGDVVSVTTNPNVAKGFGERFGKMRKTEPKYYTYNVDTSQIVGAGEKYFNPFLEDEYIVPTSGLSKRERALFLELTPLFLDYIESEHPRDEKGLWVKVGSSNPHVPPPRVYHGSEYIFDPKDIKMGEQEDMMLDRMVGAHFAEDPEVSNSFAMPTDKPGVMNKFGGVIYPIKLDIKNAKIIDQKYYAGPMKEDDRVKTDQVAIAEDIINETMPYHKDLFIKWAQKARNIRENEAEVLWDALEQNKPTPPDFPAQAKWEPDATYNAVNYGPNVKPITKYMSNVDSILMMLPGDWFHQTATKQKLVAEYRDRLKAQGYDGITYTNTAPMEIRGATNYKTWVPFDRSQVKSSLSLALANFFLQLENKEHLPAGAPGGKGGQFAPKSQKTLPFGKEKESNLRFGARSLILAELERSRGFDKLSQAQVDKYKEATQKVLDAMPDGAVDRFYKSVNSIDYMPSTKAVTDKLQLISGRMVDGTVGGFFTPEKGLLVIDGDAPWENEGRGRGTTEAIYAHEFSHAIDWTPGHFEKYDLGEYLAPGKDEISPSKEWIDAWEDEINVEPGRLSKYAMWNPSEGFGEFGRLAIMEPEKAKKDFPKSWAVWAKYTGAK